MPFKKGESGNVAAQFKPGESGNPDGRPPGIQSWSQIVRELLGDEALLDKLTSKPKGKAKEALVDAPAWLPLLPQKNLGTAIILAMGIEAMGGNDKAATWLRRTGYGEKIDLTSNDKPIKSVAIFDMRSGQQMQLAPVVAPPAKRIPKTTKKKAPVKTKKPAAKKRAVAKAK